MSQWVSESTINESIDQSDSIQLVVIRENQHPCRRKFHIDVSCNNAKTYDQLLIDFGSKQLCRVKFDLSKDRLWIKRDLVKHVITRRAGKKLAIIIENVIVPSLGLVPWFYKILTLEEDIYQAIVSIYKFCGIIFWHQPLDYSESKN